MPLETDSIGNNFGGLAGRSTTHALIEAVHTWSKALDEKKSVRILFIDYRKAFDHVDHSTVLRKMTDMGVPRLIVEWCHSFLSNRQQRVKIGDVMSDWLTLNGGMPQGTWLGLYVFLVLINDLEAAISLLKFVDDVTATEVLSREETSSMQSVVNNVIDWSKQNYMNINTDKTKEMLIGAANKNPPSLLVINDQPIERVTSFKLLGVTVSNTLNWNENTSKICSKASSRLHFLTLLKRAGMPVNELLSYYKSVIRPVMEYGCSVWQSSITEDQTHRLDAIQRRAERIILSSNNKLAELKLTPLKKRRELNAKHVFNRMLEPDNCLHELLPAKRMSKVTEKLRHAQTLPITFARTERFKRSFLPNALATFQNTDI